MPIVQAMSPPLPASPPRKAQATPQVVVSRTDSVDGPEDLQRRRKPANGSPKVHHSAAPTPKPQGKLFNPASDPISMRRTAEPETISDNGSSSYAPRNALPTPDRGAHQGRLFDHRKDDPVRFHVLARPNPANGNRPTPTPKSSGEYVSASSTSSYAHSGTSSSYAHSVTSSNFTLNSTTDGSSASSAIFEQQSREHAGSSALAVQLKRLYRTISNLESKLLRENGKEVFDEGRVTLKRPNESTTLDPEETEKEKWRTFVNDHKQYVLDYYSDSSSS